MSKCGDFFFHFCFLEILQFFSGKREYWYRIIPFDIEKIAFSLISHETNTDLDSDFSLVTFFNLIMFAMPITKLFLHFPISILCVFVFCFSSFLM